MDEALTRRALLRLACAAMYGAVAPSRAAEEPADPTAASAWLDEALASKSLAAPLHLSRFVEPIYYVLPPGIRWEPNPDNGPAFGPVVVPEGFITDLASIPPALFPFLRADGEYAQAAIVHDYLYWTQRTTRKYADDVFRIAMRDLEVRPTEIKAIHEAVSLFGNTAWEENAKLKRNGEYRFLKKYPTLAKTRWAEWKRDPSNFYLVDR